jgi:hypothetical protein
MGLIPRPAIFDQNIAALEKTGFVQAQAKCRHQIGPRLWRNRMENPITGIPAAARTPRAATLPRRRAIAPRFFSLDLRVPAFIRYRGSPSAPMQPRGVQVTAPIAT